MLIMHIFFMRSHKNCICYGNGYSQNVAVVGDTCVVSLDSEIYCNFYPVGKQLKPFLPDLFEFIVLSIISAAHHCCLQC